MTPGIASALERTRHVDAQVVALAGRLAGPVALVALGAYGRQQLTPHAEVELLVLHVGHLSPATVTERICYPLWEHGIHVEPFPRTLDECARDLRRSWTMATRLLDARLVCGQLSLFDGLHAQVQPLRRDRERLRHKLRFETQRRRASHASAVASTTPDLLAGRGGLLDLHALRWLDVPDTPRTHAALDFVLGTMEAAEALAGHATARLSAQLLQRLEANHSILEQLYGHARWVAFCLDGALAPSRDDRRLGPLLAIRRGELIAERPPPIERVPSLALRVANLAGLAPPSADVLAWASRAGPPLTWDEAATAQLWLLLRAADWRAWDFLDVTGLLVRLLPELGSLWRQPGSAATGGLAVDYHSFLALRQLHRASEADDAFIRRAWRAARHRDWVYLAVLLHELSPDAAAAATVRIGLPESARDALQLVVGLYRQLLDTAAGRDLHDEDLVLELATRIGSRQRLSMLVLVAAAHAMASGAAAWSPWRANLVRQLFGLLDVALRQPGELGARGTRAVEQRRDRILRELARRGLDQLAPAVARLPRRYLLTRSPAMAARHLAMLASGPLREGEVRIQPQRRRQPGLWDLLIVARDRPGLLAVLAGVLALRGVSVLAADAATSSDGLVLDVFTVGGAEALQWTQIEADLRSALRGGIPLHDLLGSRPVAPEEAAATEVAIDNAASQFFSVVEVRAPDQVGLLYRIASALHAERLDIHHARIATHPQGALDVFYVRDLAGEKLPDAATAEIAAALTARLRGQG